MRACLGFCEGGRLNTRGLLCLSCFVLLFCLDRQFVFHRLRMRESTPIQHISVILKFPNKFLNFKRKETTRLFSF